MFAILGIIVAVVLVIVLFYHYRIYYMMKAHVHHERVEYASKLKERKF